jgi:hypothetical protein
MALHGDPNNAAVWSGADVFIGALTATNPADGVEFNVTTGSTNWTFLGILDGSAGMAEAQANDSTDFPGWGWGVVATSRKNLKITKTVTALEDNPVVIGLAYDASGLTVTAPNYTGDLAARDLNAKLKVGFQIVQGTNIKRLITKNYAQIDTLGDATEGEDSLASRQITFGIYPDSSRKYWKAYRGVLA